MSLTHGSSTAQETVERALALSSADGCLVVLEEHSEANLRWATNTLTTNGVMSGRRLSVVATLDGARGTAAGVVSRNAATDDALLDVVRTAEEAARVNGLAEDAAPLAPPQAGLGGPWDAPPAQTSVEVFGAVAPALGEAFARARAERRAVYGFAEHRVTTTYLASSSGLRLRHDQPTGRLEYNAKSADGTDSAWVGAPTRDFHDVDVGVLDAEATTRLGWSRRRLQLPPGRYETLLPPGAVADLMIYLYWSSSARNAHDGRTALSRPGGGTRVGERLSELAVTLRSDPAYPGLECAPFVVATASGPDRSVFDNGLALAPTAWISGGTLTSLLTTRHSAALTGLPLTPAIDNLIMQGPAADGRSLPEMVAATERGLLLTCLWYMREVDAQTLLLTGLTRDGVYLIEDGQVAGAVNNFRFNESPLDLLRRVGEVGSTELTLCREWNDYFNRTAMPALRVGEFNMSTVSRAS